MKNDARGTPMHRFLFYCINNNPDKVQENESNPIICSGGTIQMI